MRWVWMGGATAVACAVVGVALWLGDLETLSWIAGAGSFITAVPSLVWALIGQPRTKVGADTASTAGSSGQEPAPTDTVALELTTASMRLAHRLRGALAGVLWALAAVIVGVSLESLFPTSSAVPLEEHPERLVQIIAWLALICGGLFFFLKDLGGRDEMNVDSFGISFIDRRLLRISNQSISVPWELLTSIRITAVGGDHAIVAMFRTPRTWEERKQIEALCNREDITQNYDGTHTLAKIRPFSLGAQRAPLLPRLRAALSRFGGSIYKD